PKAEGERGLYAFVQYAPERQAGEGKHAIACIDGLRDTPELPEGWSVATLGIHIFNIIVDETEIMNEFDSCCGRQGTLQMVGTVRGLLMRGSCLLPAPGSRCLVGQEEQRGAQQFARVACRC